MYLANTVMGTTASAKKLRTLCLYRRVSEVHTPLPQTQAQPAETPTSAGRSWGELQHSSTWCSSQKLRSSPCWRMQITFSQVGDSQLSWCLDFLLYVPIKRHCTNFVRLSDNTNIWSKEVTQTIRWNRKIHIFKEEKDWLYRCRNIHINPHLTPCFLSCCRQQNG